MAVLQQTTAARDRADLGRVARGGAVNLAGAGFAGVAGFGVTWLVTRGLGLHEAGAFFTATATFTIAVTCAKLGTQTGLVYWPARLRSQGRTDLWSACLRIALTPVTVLSVLIGIGLWSTGHLTVLAYFLPLAALSDALLAATRGCKQPRPTVLYEKLLRPGLQLIALSLALWLAPGSAAMFMWAWAIAYVPVVYLAGRAVRRAPLMPPPQHTPGSPADAEFAASVDEISNSRELRGAFWRFTGPRALASVAQQAVTRIDVILLAAMSGFAQAAYYAVAGKFIIVGQLANQALSYSVQPRLAELLAAGDRSATKALYQSATGWMVLLSWPVYLLAAVFAPLYLRFFGSSYQAASGVVMIMAGAMMVGSGCGMVDSVLSMAGRTSWNLLNVLIAIGANVIVDLALIPSMGALGAACGLAAAVLTNNLLPLTQLAWRLRLHPFGKGTCLATVLTITCFGGLPMFVTGLMGRGIAGLIVSLGVGGALFSAGCWALRGPLALSLSLRSLRRRKV